VGQPFGRALGQIGDLHGRCILGMKKPARGGLGDG